MASSLRYKIILLRHGWWFDPWPRVKLVRSLVPRIINPAIMPVYLFSAPEKAPRNTAKAIAPILKVPVTLVRIEPSLSNDDEDPPVELMNVILRNDGQSVCVSHRPRVDHLFDAIEKACGKTLDIRARWQRFRNQAVLVDVEHMIAFPVFPIVEAHGD